MTRAIVALITVLAITTAAPARSVLSHMVPTAFQGNWALVSRDCAPGPADSGNMRIAGSHIANFESRAKVSRVEMVDPHTIRLHSRVTHNGGTFGSIEMLSLSRDGKSLTIGEMSDRSIYKRCPA